MERFNAIRDPETDVDAHKLQKLLEKHDANCSYVGDVLKINILAPVIKNSKSSQRNIYLPKRLLQQVWNYYDLQSHTMPNRLRVWLMFKIGKKGDITQ